MTNQGVRRTACARIPNQYGEFKLCLYESKSDQKEHLALVMGEVADKHNVLVRVHSECFTGDVLGSQRCDCGEQLQRSIEMISEVGQGVVLYLRQEGRGIGLAEKLRAYNLQDDGHDTVDANIMLGHQADLRDYTVAAQMLDDLGVRSVRLLTNNPDKIGQLEELGIVITDRVPIQPLGINEHNRRYLVTKIERMNHMIELGETIGSTNGFPAREHA